ncbi:ethyl tert-butyl ether degradation protein [Colletotrichum tofieldiae]|uniref:Ethyl tert-butyl ether degradation protein n=1 Tax=Colletotrichum tofieldiae TaxID=708197 RepID=A0A161VS78_9PEZI|nr:ethyl tert-butyl ether degradation protein [Colletotrichum tofieldiae]GKT66240.1 ethyl tert-butyl ether degradation protein [Colletotrichum tofieldiae]GKT70591.1 ethyl tert-butyl ether degradation protein [Colletotrichum tofieldiae]GKT94537.1 ethyl tert-butyl ether degradation protein [Colletotrichum tofieldiae]
MVRLATPFAVWTTLLASSMASCTNTGQAQMVTYVKRASNITQERFWNYWQTQHAPKVAPLAVHFNITRYQQLTFIKIQVGGQILPTAAGSSEPASTEPVNFDGIAMFLYKSDEVLTAMLAHPYYLEVVEPDEHVFIDKAAFGAGMVATFVGTDIEIVDGKQDVWVGDQAIREKYEKVFQSYL